MTRLDGLRSAALTALSSSRAVPTVIGLGLALRLVGDAVVGADVPQYEFGVIAQNLDDGRGFSYFSADQAGQVAISASGHPLPSAFMPPLYTFVMAVADALTTSPHTATRIVQGINLVLAGVAIYLFVRLLRFLFNPAVAVIGGAFIALYPPLAYSSTQISASNAYLPLEIALLFLLARLSSATTARRVVAVGALLGLLTWLRSEAVVFLPLAAVWCWRFGSVSRPRRAPALAALLLVVSLLLPLAWMARNSVVLDRPVASITTTAGFNFWIGNHDGASGSQKKLSLGPAGDRAEESVEQQLTAVLASNGYEVDRDQVYMTAATSYVRSHPGETALRDLKKFAMLLVGDVYDTRSNALTLAANVVLLAGGLWGLARTRLAGRHLLLLGGYVFVAAAIASVFFTLERYALPLRIVLAMFLAERLWTVLSARRRVEMPQTRLP